MATIKKAKPGSGKAEADRKREIFARAYLANGGNGTQAAIEAGWSAKTAHVQACQQLKHPKVRAIIEAAAKKTAEASELKVVEVLQELRKIVHADLRKLFNDDGSLKEVKDWPDDVAAAVSSIEVEEIWEGTGKDRKFVGHSKKLKLWDKNSAVDKAMKHLGLFEKNNEQSKASVTFVISSDDADL